MAAESQQGVPAQTLARVLELDEGQLRTLARRRIIPASTNGRYSFAESILGYVRHLRAGSVSRYATSAEIAAIYGFSNVRFTQLRQAGAFPDPAPGLGFDRDGCARQYARWLIARDREPQGAAEKLRELKLQREQLDMDVASGKLLPMDDIARAVVEYCGVLAQRLDAIASRLATRLAAETNPALVRRMLLDEIRTARNAAAEKIAHLARRPLRGKSAHAADQNAGRVGGAGARTS